MRPNAVYTPKVVAAPYHNQVIELAVFSPPPFASAEDECMNELCPGHALQFYIKCIKAFRQSYQLFVWFGTQTKGRALSKPGCSRWIVEAFELSYTNVSSEAPEELHAHSIWGISASWEHLKGISVEDIC